MISLTDEQPGHCVFRGTTFQFDRAYFSFDDLGLFLDAQGADTFLVMTAIPFPGVSNAAELAGQSFAPDDDTLCEHADTFAESGFDLNEQPFYILCGRFDCLAFDDKHQSLTVSFQLKISDSANPPGEDLSGVVRFALKQA